MNAMLSAMHFVHSEFDLVIQTKRILLLYSAQLHLSVVVVVVVVVVVKNLKKGERKKRGFLEVPHARAVVIAISQA